MRLFRAWALPTGLRKLPPPCLPPPANLLPFCYGGYTCCQTPGNGCSPAGWGQPGCGPRVQFRKGIFQPLLVSPRPGHGTHHPWPPEVTSPELSPRTHTPHGSSTPSTISPSPLTHQRTRQQRPPPPGPQGIRASLCKCWAFK